MKSYEFNIYVTESERGAIQGMVITHPFQVILTEFYTGSLERLTKRVQEIRQELIKTHQFEAGKGFSVDARLRQGQRKPAGYDARRIERSTNYIAG
jgi:hypothetical protein